MIERPNGRLIFSLLIPLFTISSSIIYKTFSKLPYMEFFTSIGYIYTFIVIPFICFISIMAEDSSLLEHSINTDLDPNIYFDFDFELNADIRQSAIDEMLSKLDHYSEIDDIECSEISYDIDYIKDQHTSPMFDPWTNYSSGNNMNNLNAWNGGPGGPNGNQSSLPYIDPSSDKFDKNTSSNVIERYFGRFNEQRWITDKTMPENVYNLDEVKKLYLLESNRVDPRKYFSNSCLVHKWSEYGLRIKHTGVDIDTNNIYYFGNKIYTFGYAEVTMWDKSVNRYDNEGVFCELIKQHRDFAGIYYNYEEYRGKSKVLYSLYMRGLHTSWERYTPTPIQDQAGNIISRTSQDLKIDNLVNTSVLNELGNIENNTAQYIQNESSNSINRTNKRSFSELGNTENRISKRLKVSNSKKSN